MSLTHFDKQGQAHMANVENKAASEKAAVAEGHIVMLANKIRLYGSRLVKQGHSLLVIA